MGKNRLIKDETCLMIVDVQERLVPVMNEAEKLVDNTNRLIEAINVLGLPIYVTEQYPKGLGHTVEELEGLKEAVFFEKTSFTAASEELVASLREKGIKKVVLAGIETHICVYQTARDLVDLGFDVFLVREAVSSRTSENTENGMDLIRSAGGLVSNLETVVFDLLKDAKSEGFKEISRIIK